MVERKKKPVLRKPKEPPTSFLRATSIPSRRIHLIRRQPDVAQENLIQVTEDGNTLTRWAGLLGKTNL
jgi:hypothetical protein